MDIVKWARAQWDRVTAVLAAAGGIIALLLGWIGVSGTAYPAGQLPYLASGGLLGIFLLGVAGTLWLSADLRDEWRKLDRVEDALRSLEARALAATSVAEPVGGLAEAPATSRNGNRKKVTTS
jgi:hypothetical protein